MAVGEETEKTSAEQHTSSGSDRENEGSRSPETEGATNPSPLRPQSTILWLFVLISILSSSFLYALDNTVVADVQPSIIKTFGEISKLPWLSVSFLLSAVTTILTWGQLFSVFNAKWLYIIAMVIFEAGSALCGGANTMNTLIVGRALAGLGGSGTYVGILTLLSITTTEKERPIYMSLTGLTWGLGTVLGPVIGGAFADSSATWRWAFYINLIVGAICAPAYILLLPSIDPQIGTTSAQRLRSIDIVGSILVIGAIAAGVMAVNFGGVIYPWHSGRIIGLFCTSGILFVIFGVQQAFSLGTMPVNRLFPVQFLQSRSLVLLFMTTASAGTALFVPIYFIPLFFQFVSGDSSLDAGVRLLPFICLLIFASVMSGIIISRTGYYVPSYLLGGVLGLIGGALMFTVDQNSSSARIYGYTAILAFGTGCYSQASFAVSQAKVPPTQIPSAVGFISFAQLLGFTCGLSISNSVFLNFSTDQIRHILPDTPVAAIQSLISGADSSLFQILSPNIQRAIVDIVVKAMAKVYILVITASVVTVLGALIMRREKLQLAMGMAG
ncbi:major facilitator superfamily domain-containing protein [Xylogone sp. PMI_703]|nr:major facilitator superfamily domain-containing protein [Xylogone sp. PMI_703]